MGARHTDFGAATHTWRPAMTHTHRIPRLLQMRAKNWLLDALSQERQGKTAIWAASVGMRAAPRECRVAATGDGGGATWGEG